MTDDGGFKKFDFTPEGIDRFLESADHDLAIARESKRPEVRFIFSYNALIKAGLALIAARKGEKVRSVPGHHLKVLETMSRLLKDEDVLIGGNAMRMKRNTDLYGGGGTVTEKESGDYLDFVEKTVKKVTAAVRK